MIELIIILAILIICGKHILFNVKVNSVIFIILGIASVSWKPPFLPVTNISIVLLALSIIDCIRDIAISDNFYRSLEYGFDSQYVVKSLTTVALILFGWFLWNKNLVYALFPRVIFLCIINPAIAIKVNHDVNDKVKLGYPLPYNEWQYSDSRKERYYYKKIIKRLYDNGTLVVNIDVIVDEKEKSNNKYSQNYPKTIIAKFIRLFSKDTIKEMKNIENELSDTVLIKHAAYISSAYFEQYADKIAKVLKSRQGTFSPWSIKNMVELRDLNLNAQSGHAGDVKWSEYFIIKSLKQLVRSGDINDEDYNDNDPLNNHAYGVQIKSNSLDDNPLFADI